MEKYNFPNIDSIEVLTGLQAIRRRPSMYIGDLNNPKVLTKLIIESMCLSRALACDEDGSVKHIEVTINGNEVTISDDGPGVSMEPSSNPSLSFLELLLTVLFACKELKHEKTKDLCDVGIVITNALSEFFTAVNTVNYKRYVISYTHGELKAGPALSDFPSEHNGLTLHFKFDKAIFGDLKIDKEDVITEIEKMKAATSANITLTFNN